MRTKRFRYLWLAAMLWLILAYLALPLMWIERDRSVDTNPASMVTRTEADIPGDPINVGLIGDREAVMRAFAAAGWDAADAITLKSALEIGGSVIFDRPYPDAPVSTLLYYGRKQDLAFEKPDGTSADRRHHVRLWQTPDVGPEGREFWLGSASFDQGVGLSHDTAQVTHHIAPDIDLERDSMIAELQKAGWVVSTYDLPGVDATQDGRNGGGDPYFTDGKVLVGILKANRETF
jgi:hypothetical protein